MSRADNAGWNEIRKVLPQPGPMSPGGESGRPAGPRNPLGSGVMEGRMGVPEEEPTTDVEMEPGVDVCCQNAINDTRALFESLASKLAAYRVRNHDPDWKWDIIEEMENHLWAENHPDFCSYLHYQLERWSKIPYESNPKWAGTDKPDYEYMIAGVKQILAEWDACVGQQSGDFTASNDSFEDAWRVVKYELTPSSQRYAREEVGPGPTTLTAVEARPASVDPCCEEARGKLLHAITGTPYDPENGFEGHGEWEPNMEDLTCDELRNWWDAELNVGTNLFFSKV